MKNVRIIPTVAVLFVLVGLLISYFACSSQTAGGPTMGGEIIIKQSGGAGLLIKECSDQSYIIETSDYIIEGTVEKVESRWNEDRTSIFTYSDVAIEKYVKGTPLDANRIQMVTPGGTVGDVTQAMEDQPILHEGTQVTLYLQEINGEYTIVCGSLGVQER
jgi:hypothetical protein